MLQSDGVQSAPILGFEAWRALVRSNCGGEVKVTAPNAFAGWMRPLSACGLAAAAVKIQWRPAAGDLGCYAHRVERTHRDVRLDCAGHYLILFQVAGRSALTQIDQTVQLTAGDVALVDAARPDPRPISCSTDKLFERICGVIRDGLSDPDFGPHEVAVAARVSLRYVQKLFTERGTTCREFIYSLRLGHAAHLLQRRALLRTGKPLSEIACACSFRDYAHFARRFRNRFGCPPGAHAGYDQSADHGTVRAGTGESASSTHDVQAGAS